MTDRPPGVPLARKHVWLADHCVLDVLEGFPTDTTWYLGLIFIAPEARNTGLGRRVLEDLVAYARERGAAALRLAVAVENTAARRLYDRLGFAHVARRARQTWTGLTQQVDVLERAITSPA